MNIRRKELISDFITFVFLFLDSEAFEFYIVSLDNKQWHFEAASSEERDEWVSVIEQEIFRSLQGNESAKVKQLTSSEVASMQSIRSRVPGNGHCVDCDAPSKFKLLENQCEIFSYLVPTSVQIQNGRA